jgi:hypothetical protein
MNDYLLWKIFSNIQLFYVLHKSMIKRNYCFHLFCNKYKLFLLACKKGSSKFIRKIINFNIISKYANIGFFESCLNGHYEIVKFLIIRPFINPRHNNNSGLYISCLRGFYEIANILSIFFDDNFFNTYNELFNALCISGHTKIIKFLCSLSNLYYSCINKGFYYACINDNINIVKYLYNNYPSHIFDIYDIFIEICQYENIRTIKFLSKKIDLSFNNFKALMNVCRSDNIKIAKIILDNISIDINTKNRALSKSHSNDMKKFFR